MKYTILILVLTLCSFEAVAFSPFPQKQSLPHTSLMLPMHLSLEQFIKFKRWEEKRYWSFLLKIRVPTKSIPQF